MCQLEAMTYHTYKCNTFAPSPHYARFSLKSDTLHSASSMLNFLPCSTYRTAGQRTRCAGLRGVLYILRGSATALLYEGLLGVVSIKEDVLVAFKLLCKALR
jgi:hypothetical protein